MVEKTLQLDEQFQQLNTTKTGNAFRLEAPRNVVVIKMSIPTDPKWHAVLKLRAKNETEVNSLLSKLPHLSNLKFDIITLAKPQRFAHLGV